MKNYNLVDEPVLKTLVKFSFPIIVMNAVQQLLYTADIAVLSVMTNDTAVAAIGACGSIISLLISLFTGFASGANVLVARLVGAKDNARTKKTAGSSLWIGLISGIILMIAGVIFAEDFLIITKCPPSVLKQAATYLRLYLCGMPVVMLYNFVCAVLRGLGNSNGPMVYAVVSGCTNVVLNVIFVWAFSLTVEAVAIATVAANFLALVLALIALFKSREFGLGGADTLRAGWGETLEILKIGVPICLGGIFFYIANVVISAAVNEMGPDAMTANTIAGQFDGIVYNVGYSVAIAASVIVGQNFGAGRVSRIRRCLVYSSIYVTAISLLLGGIFVLLSRPIFSFMTGSDSILELAAEKLAVLCFTYFLTSIMEVFSFSLRAMGRHKSTMVVSAVCGLGIRGGWVALIWHIMPTISFLFLCYAVSAFAAVVIYVFVYLSAEKQTLASIKSGESQAKKA